MHISFKGRVALVAGAGQGIGRAIAVGLAAAGARVHCADIIDIAWAAGEGHTGVRCHKADLSKRDGARAVVDAVVQDEKRLDILVNAAGGVCGQVGRPIEEVDEASWHAIFAANIDSAFWLAQATAPAMQRTGHGRIVFITSGAGLRPSLTGIQAYTSAKHALCGLTKQLSQDLGRHGITCNAVAPGFVRSNPSSERQWQSYGEEGQRRLVETIHTRRTGTAEDIANAAIFLASDQAAWISGEIVSVNGGRS